MNKKIIIFGSHKDPHIQSVSKFLTNLTIDFYFLDHEKPFNESIIYQNGTLFVPVMDGLNLIWDRSKIFLPLKITNNKHQEEYVIKAGWNDFYAFLKRYALHKGIQFINTPKSEFVSKVISLYVASILGFNTPATVICSCISELKSFAKLHSSLVIKTIDIANIPDTEILEDAVSILTQRVTKEDIDQMTEEELTICPQLFQQEIKKKIELRVVATKEKIFTYAIDSQKHQATSVDWRIGNSFLPFTPIKEYDEYLFPRIKKYFAKTGLIYGSFDFIVTPENEIYFLECNQEGQWYWLEEQNHEGIPQAIAEAIFMAIPQ